MDERVRRAAAVLESVYGPFTGPDWRPAPFEARASRYLWTDAFGVNTFLSLHKATGNERFLHQALALAADVHATLGHARPVPGGPPPAWLPGASDQHPTLAGLRIGKHHPEGHPDGDGQYFHYLTKWAFALMQLADAAHEPRFLAWAVELMQTAVQRFTYQTPQGVPKMVWKMSTDLSRPAVPSMGGLDPYDGLVTCCLLQDACAAAAASGAGGSGSQVLAASEVLASEVATMRAMVDARFDSYTSDDPLDLGEALWLAHWRLGEPWAEAVAAAALAGLDALWSAGFFSQPLARRLAFREFGTSLGLQALLAARPTMQRAPTWAARADQILATWAQHLTTRDADITPVMHAACLVPHCWIRGGV